MFQFYFQPDMDSCKVKKSKYFTLRSVRLQHTDGVLHAFKEITEEAKIILQRSLCNHQASKQTSCTCMAILISVVYFSLPVYPLSAQYFVNPNSIYCVIVLYELLVVSHLKQQVYLFCTFKIDDIILHSFSIRSHALMIGYHYSVHTAMSL